MKKIISITLFLMCCFTYGQKIKGYVCDKIGPLMGVTITVQSTNRNTTTDINGKFEIEIDKNHNTLIFSCLGFKTKALRLTGSKTLTVTMEIDLTALEKVYETIPPEVEIEEMEVMKDCVEEISFVNYKKHKVANFCSKKINSPLIKENESYSKLNFNDFKEVTKNPLSTFSADVDRAAYSNIRRFIYNGSTPPVDAVRIEEMINYFKYDYKNAKKEPFSTNTELGLCPWNNKNLLLHIGLQGKNIEMSKLPASNIVFLLDVSGSMDSPKKLPLLKSSLRLLLQQLRPKDKVAIVVYAGNSGLVLPSTSCNNKKLILEKLENLSAGGSTNGGKGLKLAYKIAQENFIKNGNNRILLATDGDFNVGIRNNNELERYIEKQRNNGIGISILGFGMGNYKDDKAEIIANKGNGNYAYIDNILEAKKVLVNEFGGTFFTIAKDVKFQLEFNPAFVSKYRLIGYENRILEDEDFDNDKKDAGEIGAGHTVTAIYEIIPSTNGIIHSNTLKYQSANLTNIAKDANEIATLKIRYKKPKGTKSKLIEYPILNKPVKNTSNNFKFSASICEFGMLLRKSKHKANSTWQSAIKLAKEGKGNDEQGYRGEMIRLMETAQLLNKK